MVQCSEKQSQLAWASAECGNGRKGSVWKRKNGVGLRRSEAGEGESWESPGQFKGAQRKRRHTEICMGGKRKH